MDIVTNIAGLAQFAISVCDAVEANYENAARLKARLVLIAAIADEIPPEQRNSKAIQSLETALKKMKTLLTEWGAQEGSGWRDQVLKFWNVYEDDGKFTDAFTELDDSIKAMDVYFDVILVKQLKDLAKAQQAAHTDVKAALKKLHDDGQNRDALLLKVAEGTQKRASPPRAIVPTAQSGTMQTRQQVPRSFPSKPGNLDLKTRRCGSFHDITVNASSVSHWGKTLGIKWLTPHAFFFSYTESNHQVWAYSEDRDGYGQFCLTPNFVDSLPERVHKRVGPTPQKPQLGAFHDAHITEKTIEHYGKVLDVFWLDRNILAFSYTDYNHQAWVYNPETDSYLQLCVNYNIASCLSSRFHARKTG